MRIKKVRELITDAILAERERCAKIADREADDPHASNPAAACAEAIAAEIRSANPPVIRVIRPETAEKQPELVTHETIIAGTSYAGLD